MTRLTLTTTSLANVAADAVIVGVAKADGGLVVAPGAADIDKALKRRLKATLSDLGATGALGQVTRLPTFGATKAPTVVAVGLGQAPARRQGYDPAAVRRAVGAAVRSLAGTGKVATALATVNGDNDPATVRAVAEGAALGGYTFAKYRSNASSDAAKPPVGTVSLVVPNNRDKGVRAAVDRAIVLGDAVALARDLVNTPAADLHPADLAAAAERACTEAGCTVEVYDEKALAKGGHGGILGVGQGAANPPRLVRIAWHGDTGNGRKPAAGTAVHLVGKGITFDSGGLSLKTATGMEWMKADMGGAAAVIATLLAAARSKLPVDVVGWIASAENMPSGTAIRPSDVLTMRGGKTVEVMNTDAEGRLVMADAIVRAGEEEPAAIVDIATLTGAQLVALGSRVFAVMSNDDELRAELVAAADGAGEQAWPMPLPDELRASLDSPVADISNMGDRYGGMLVAGLFLKEFVPDGVPWGHLDVAGPAWNEGEPHGYTPKGGTGVPVATLLEFLERRA
ncbi:MAG TPA: leucyl aminopeptidase [Mycobacteriales bacterium]|nr:leucyl aminopeptidase [Mycobacteriales bacterium]